MSSAKRPNRPLVRERRRDMAKFTTLKHDMRRVAPSWRAIEQNLLDSFRQMGVPVEEWFNGATYVVAYTYDPDTGQLIAKHQVLNVEKLAQQLALKG
jgi:hypothetical protein